MGVTWYFTPFLSSAFTADEMYLLRESLPPPTTAIWSSAVTILSAIKLPPYNLTIYFDNRLV
jgi:hypothetical protein